MNLETLIVPLQLDKTGFDGGIDSAIKKIAGFAALSAGVIAVTAAIKGAVDATFTWANEIDMLGDVIGGTNEDMAAMAFIARKAGVPVEALTKANVMLEKGLVKSNGQLDTVGKSLKEYGINVKDANGNVKDSVQLTDEISRKYNSLSTQQERINFLTEIYGKNGAAMVDFYDTLAKEGGIDAARKKVEEFGLVLDPARMENFTRNMNELKMMFLGVQVAITEFVMPALENFLKLARSVATGDWAQLKLDVTTSVSNIKAWMTSVIKGMTDTLRNWLDTGGPEQLIKMLTGWVNGLGKPKTPGPTMESLMAKGIPENVAKSIIGPDTNIVGALSGLIQAISDAISRLDFTPVADALDRKIADAINNADFSESKKAIATFFSDALDPKKNTGFSNLFSGGLVNDLIEGVAGSAMFAAIKARWATLWAELKTMAGPAGVAIGDALSASLNSTKPVFLNSANQFGLEFHNWLVKVANDAYSTALTWGQKMKKGFEDGKNGLLKIVSDIVDGINKELDRIRGISISVDLKGVHITMPGTTGSRPGGGVAGIGGIASPIPRTKATGGPVYAGEMYRVNERNHEFFTPAMNGFVSPTRSNEVSLSKQTISELAQQLGVVIPTATVKAMNNV